VKLLVSVIWYPAKSMSRTINWIAAGRENYSGKVTVAKDLMDK